MCFLYSAFVAKQEHRVFNEFQTNIRINPLLHTVALRQHTGKGVLLRILLTHGSSELFSLVEQGLVILAKALKRVWLAFYGVVGCINKRKVTPPSTA